MIIDYNTNTQKLLLETILQDGTSYTRVQPIFNSDNFDRSIKPAADYIKTYCEKFSTLPTAVQIKAETGVDLQPVPQMAGHEEWFLTTFESFTKRKELERAILKAADMIEKGEYDPVEKIIKDAVKISLSRDMGTDYFHDPKTRLTEYFDNGYKISTGWPSLDSVLYGGFSKGELNIFAGGSGSGKSLFMMNIAINWLQAGYNGVYISLELSEGLTSLRTDAMFTDMGTKDIRKNIDDTAMKIATSRRGGKFGKYRIKAMPAQSNVNNIRSYIHELQIQSGFKVDFIMVDYLDLLMPVSVKVNPSDQFVKDKYVAEELRNLATELDVLLITASQLNRSAVEEVEFDHSHISGGISKINTADNVFGIFTSRAMKERGRYQLQCMKNRSGAGNGKKIDLDYNIESMRISDPGEDAQGTPGSLKPQVGSIMSQIKGKSSVSDDETASGPAPFKRGEPKPGFSLETPRVAGEAQTTKLKQMLAGLKSGN